MKLLCVLLFALICLGECADNSIKCKLIFYLQDLPILIFSFTLLFFFYYRLVYSKLPFYRYSIILLRCYFCIIFNVNIFNINICSFNWYIVRLEHSKVNLNMKQLSSISFIFMTDVAYNNVWQ